MQAHGDPIPWPLAWFVGPKLQHRGHGGGRGRGRKSINPLILGQIIFGRQWSLRGSKYFPGPSFNQASRLWLPIACGQSTVSLSDLVAIQLRASNTRASTRGIQTRWAFGLS